MEIQIFDWQEKHFRGGPCCEPPLKTSFQVQVMAATATGNNIFKGSSWGGPPLKICFEGRLVPWPIPRNWFSEAGPLPVLGKLDF